MEYGGMNKQLSTKLREMSTEALEPVIEGAKDFAMYKGIGMRDLILCKDARVHLPFCLIPSEFPKEWFYYVYNLQMSVNKVLHKISYSRETIEECLKNSIENDEFIKNIFNIFEKVFDSQSKQMSLGLIRSDYLLTWDQMEGTNGIKQVENNTFAVGLAGISPLLRDLYRFILEKLEWKDFSCHLPENKSCEIMANAMISAWHAYGKQGAVIIFVVEESTFNIYDQRLLEYKIVELESQIEVLRYTFKKLRTCVVLKDKILYVNGKEVAVVYFRVGYAPEHYEPEISDHTLDSIRIKLIDQLLYSNYLKWFDTSFEYCLDWTTRLLIEQSTAIKCPSVGLHLAGTKRVQLYLTQEGVLEKFVDPVVADKLRSVFANQYSFDKDNGGAIISKAIKHHADFVLKPEREGGGNNLYGMDIKAFLEREESEKRKSFILMEKINPPAIPNFIVRSHKTPESCLVHNELGIFGVILGNKDHIYMNETAGHLLRSKSARFNEGGVASGSGALNYPYLV